MSYTIEYNKVIFYSENENKERTYYLFIRQGDNNVYDSNGLRSKDWNFIRAGSEKELWKVIGRRLGAIHGGGLQRAVGFGTAYYTEEDYIRQYRSKFKNAKPIEKLLETFWINAHIYMRDEFKHPEYLPTQKLLKEFIARYNMKPCGRDYYDSSKIKYQYSIKDVETLKYFLLNFPQSWSEDYRSGFVIDKY